MSCADRIHLNNFIQNNETKETRSPVIKTLSMLLSWTLDLGRNSW